MRFAHSLFRPCFAGCALSSLVLAHACAPIVSDGTDAPNAAPTSYRFASRFQENRNDAKDSVQYAGQSARHVLMAQLKNRIGNLQDDAFSNASVEDVISLLNFDYDFKNQGGAESDALPSMLLGPTALEQETFGDVGGLVSLKEKVAGIDNPFSKPLIGVSDATLTPDALLQSWFEELAQMVIQRAVDGELPKDPHGNDIERPYLMPDGRDLQQLVHKFVYGAVAYSQACDDYLDDDTEGKGLLSDNTQPAADALYTVLEHAWDEGFGYFGAARDYNSYTDSEIAGVGGRESHRFGYFDADGNGRIDLLSEVNLGHALNAAKRDLTATDRDVDFDLTRDAFEAFLQGRALITNAAGALSADQLDELRTFRDAALGAWEKALAASVIHYLNETLRDMNHFGSNCANSSQSDCYRFADHAKHWSEMKGFALTLQFNPRAQLNEAEMQTLHDLLGETPVLPNAIENEIASYRAKLLDARARLGAAYAFPAALLGDDQGQNGF